MPSDKKLLIMRNKGKILLTGASGFIGKNVSQYLINHGYHVLGVSRKAQSLDPSGLDWLRLGKGYSDIEEIIRNERDILAVVHLAGRINGSEPQLKKDNELFTDSLIKALENLSPQSKLILVSSVSATKALGAYGKSKLACEGLVRHSHLQNWVILRPSLVFGPYDTKNVGRFLAWVKYSPLIPVPGGNKVLLQPLSVRDLSLTIKQILNGKGSNRCCYILSGPEQLPLIEMIRTIQKTLNKSNFLLPIPLKPLQTSIGILGRFFPFLHLPVQQISSLHSHAPWDCAQTRNELGFQPVTFEEGIMFFWGKPDKKIEVEPCAE